MSYQGEIMPQSETISSPLQLRLAIDTLLFLPISHIHTEGLESVSGLDEPAIVIASHRTGLDMPLAIKVLGKDMDLAVTDQSTHRSKDELAGWVGMKVAGEQNFLPIDYTFDGDKKEPAMFRPADVDPVLAAMQRGKSVLTAAYNAVESEDPRPPRPGYSAAYTSLLTGAPIVPVGIRTGRQHMLSRSPAAVVIGEPLSFAADPSIESLREVLDKRSGAHSLSRSDIKEVARDMGLIRERGREFFAMIMKLEDQAKDLLDSKG